MLGLGLGIPFAQAPLVWSPALLPAPSHGGWFKISNAASVTTSSGNITAVADSFGGSAVLGATAAIVPIGTDASTGAKYAAIRAANVGATYPSLFGNVMSTASNAPWTVTFIQRWLGGPSSSGSSQFVSFGYIGGNGPGSVSGNPVLFGMGPADVYAANHNSTSAYVLTAGQGVWAPFGRETLATGASGATIPSTQVITYMYDGAGTLSLWIDGVLQPTQSGGTGGTKTGLTITLTSALLVAGTWYNGAPSADRDVYEVIAVDYAMTPKQIKQIAAYAQPTYGFAKTTKKWTFGGDSVEFGSNSSNVTTTSYNALLPQIISEVFSVPIVVANCAITSTTTEQWINSQTHAIKFNNFDWQTATYAMGFSPMATANYAGIEWGFNENALTTTSLATFEGYDAAAAAILRGWGFSKLLRTNIFPIDATLSATYPQVAANRAAFNAYMRGAVPSIWDAILDWDSTDTTALPGVSAWSSSTAYTAPANGGPPWIVSFGGVAYFALANSTNVQPGTDATKWVALDGPATFAAVVATLADASGYARGDATDVHMGYQRATGDLGGTVYAYAKALVVARMLGLM